MPSVDVALPAWRRNSFGVLRVGCRTRTRRSEGQPPLHRRRSGRATTSRRPRGLERRSWWPCTPFSGLHGPRILKALRNWSKCRARERSRVSWPPHRSPREMASRSAGGAASFLRRGGHRSRQGAVAGRVSAAAEVSWSCQVVGRGMHRADCSCCHAVLTYSASRSLEQEGGCATDAGDAPSPRKTRLLVLAHPGVHRMPRHRIPGRDLSDRDTCDHAQLHQRGRGPADVV